MIRTIIGTLFVTVSLGLAAPPAFADRQSDFEQRCVDQGGTLVDGSCHNADGSVTTCSFGEDEWACVNTEGAPAVRGTKKLFERKVNVPFKTIKRPSGPGPVEMEVSKTVTKQVDVQSSSPFGEAVQSAPLKSQITVQSAQPKALVVGPTVTFKLAN